MGRPSKQHYNPSVQTLVHWLTQELLSTYDCYTHEERVYEGDDHAQWGGWFSDRLSALHLWGDGLSGEELKRLLYAENKKASSWRSLERHELALIFELMRSLNPDHVKGDLGEEPQLNQELFEALYIEFERSNQLLESYADQLSYPARWVTVIEWGLPRLASLLGLWAVSLLEKLDLKELKTWVFSLLDPSLMSASAQLSFRVLGREVPEAEREAAVRELEPSVKRLIEAPLHDGAERSLPNHVTLHSLATLGSRAPFNLTSYPLGLREMILKQLLILSRALSSIRRKALDQIKADEALLARAQSSFKRFRADCERAHLMYSSHKGELDRFDWLDSLHPANVSTAIGRGVMGTPLAMRLHSLSQFSAIYRLSEEEGEPVRPADCQPMVDELVTLARELVHEGFEPQGDGCEKAKRLDQLHDGVFDALPERLMKLRLELKTPEEYQLVMSSRVWAHAQVMAGELKVIAELPPVAAQLFGLMKAEHYMIKQALQLLTIEPILPKVDELRAPISEGILSIGLAPAWAIWGDLEERGELYVHRRLYPSWLLILCTLIRRCGLTHCLLEVAPQLYERIKQPLGDHEARALAEVALALWCEVSQDKRSFNKHHAQLVKAGAEGLFKRLSKNPENYSACEG